MRPARYEKVTVSGNSPLMIWYYDNDMVTNTLYYEYDYEYEYEYDTIII
jgi:hypothetical protein